MEHFKDNLILLQNLNFKTSSETRFFLGKMRSLMDNQDRLEKLNKSFSKPPKLVVFFENFFLVEKTRSMDEVFPVYVLSQETQNFVLKKCALYVDLTEHGFKAINENVGTNISCYLNIFMLKVVFKLFFKKAIWRIREGNGPINWYINWHLICIPEKVLAINPELKPISTISVNQLKEQEIFINKQLPYFLSKKLNDIIVYVNHKRAFYLTDLGPTSYYSCLHWPVTQILQDIFGFYITCISLLSVFFILWDLSKGFLPKKFNLWLLAETQKTYASLRWFFSWLIFPFLYLIIVIKTIVLTFFETTIIIVNCPLISLGGTKLKLFEKIKWAFLSESLFVRSLSNLRF